mgnify:CR=1 FL=1
MQRLARKPTCHLGAQRKQGIEIHAGWHAHAGEEIRHVFAADVAAGARRVRAAADAGAAKATADRRAAASEPKTAAAPHGRPKPSWHGGKKGKDADKKAGGK